MECRSGHIITISTIFLSPLSPPLSNSFYFSFSVSFSSFPRTPRSPYPQALGVLKRAGVSAAIFAPGWLLETQVNNTMRGERGEGRDERGKIGEGEKYDEFRLQQSQLVYSSLVFWSKVKSAWDAEPTVCFEDRKERREEGHSHWEEKSRVHTPLCSRDWEYMDIRREERGEREDISIEFSLGAGTHCFVDGERFTHWSSPPSLSSSAFFDLSIQRFELDMGILLTGRDAEVKAERREGEEERVGRQERREKREKREKREERRERRKERSA